MLNICYFSPKIIGAIGSVEWAKSVDKNVIIMVIRINIGSGTAKRGRQLAEGGGWGPGVKKE